MKDEPEFFFLSFVPLSPASQAWIPLFGATWGVRPRLYAFTCSAGSLNNAAIRE
jgi:hypothetical protein